MTTGALRSETTWTRPRPEIGWMKMRPYLALMLTVVMVVSGCAASTEGTDAASSPSPANLLYTLDGVGVDWCDRIDFRSLAVMPGELMDGRPPSHVGADQLLCSRTVVDKDSKAVTNMVVMARVFATVDQAKEAHTRNSGGDYQPLDLDVDVDDANTSFSDQNRFVRVLHRNLRITVTVGSSPALTTTHSAAMDQAMPAFAAGLVRMMRGSV